MSLMIYDEQKRYLSQPRIYNYLPEDITYRVPWNIGDTEPPLRVLYPILLKKGREEVLDPLTIYIGRTPSKKPFAYNPRYIVNPLMLIVGTPGAGKSLPPDEPIVVLRNGDPMVIPIAMVRVGDYVVSVDSLGNLNISVVRDVIVHGHKGSILVIKTSSGRVLRVTGDHSVVTFRDGRIVSVSADKLKVGDPLLTPLWLSPEIIWTRWGVVLDEFVGRLLACYFLSRIRGVEIDVLVSEDYLNGFCGLGIKHEDSFVELKTFINELSKTSLEDILAIILFSPLDCREGFIEQILSFLNKENRNNIFESTNGRIVHLLSLILSFNEIPSKIEYRKQIYRLTIYKNGEYNTTRINNVLIDPIVSIEETAYNGEVYDLSTEDETFMTGTGILVHNSATLKTIIHSILQNTIIKDYQLSRNIPILVVDPEGEYHILGKMIGEEKMLHLKLGRRDYINLFDRPSKTINPFAWYMRMMAVLQKFLSIAPAQATQAYRVLKKAVLEVAKDRGITFDPTTWWRSDITLEEIYKWINNQIETLEQKKKLTQTERMFYRGASTLQTRLDQWMQPPNDAFSKKSTIDLSNIFNYNLVILDSAGLAKDLFGIFTYWIVYWTYGLMLEKGPLPEFGIRMVLVIDEAWALLRKNKREEENPLEALARRGRKYGIMIIVATQTPEDVDEKMFSLFGTLATGIIPSEKMVNKIVESRGMPKRFKSVINSLERGRLVWSINWAKRDFPMSKVPIIVKTDYPISGVIQID